MTASREHARHALATIGGHQSVTLKMHTFTGAVAGKRRGVDCGRAVSVMITFVSPPH